MCSWFGSALTALSGGEQRAQLQPELSERRSLVVVGEAERQLDDALLFSSLSQQQATQSGSLAALPFFSSPLFLWCYIYRQKVSYERSLLTVLEVSGERAYGGSWYGR
jgi:hypothetical protein